MIMLRECKGSERKCLAAFQITVYPGISLKDWGFQAAGNKAKIRYDVFSQIQTQTLVTTTESSAILLIYYPLQAPSPYQNKINYFLSTFPWYPT
jgi:hypothetical protein